jgi:tripartite-type tricarboxylate transporter receptor subunit TctC
MKRSKVAILAMSMGLTAPGAYAQAPAPGSAQAYPARPIRLVIPTSPGGTSDILGRLLGQKLGEALGQQIIPDNRAGASNTIGIALVAKSPPDGYTIVITPASLAINPAIFRKMPYDAPRDLAPISRLAESPSLLALHPSIPARNVKQLIALAKANPGSLTLASSGAGTIPHMAAELFNLMAGVNMVQIIYKGSGQGILSTLSGEISAMYASPIQLMPQVKAGKLRALAITSQSRSPALPGLPSIAETLPGYEAMQWFGVLAPAGTPRPIVDRLSQEIARIMRSADIKDRLAADGMTVVASTPDEFASTLRLEMEKWAKVIKAAGIPPQ